MDSNGSSPSENHTATQVATTLVSKSAVPKPSSYVNGYDIPYNQFVPSRPIRSSRNTSPVYKYPSFAKLKIDAAKKRKLEVNGDTFGESITTVAKHHYETREQVSKRSTTFGPHYKFVRLTEEELRNSTSLDNHEETSSETTQHATEVTNSKLSDTCPPNTANDSLEVSEPILDIVNEPSSLKDDLETPPIVSTIVEDENMSAKDDLETPVLVSTIMEEENIPAKDDLATPALVSTIMQEEKPEKIVVSRNKEARNVPKKRSKVEDMIPNFRNVALEYGLHIPYFPTLRHVDALHRRMELRICLAETLKNQMDEIMYTFNELMALTHPDVTNWRINLSLEMFRVFLARANKANGNLYNELSKVWEMESKQLENTCIKNVEI